jgi:outer membrane biosynthesis protein TonB
MIKNLLYSLFLHFLLLMAIYANFNLKEVDETKTTEIAVSLISLSGSEHSNKTKPSAVTENNQKIEEKKEIKNEKKIATTEEKKSKKNQVKEQQKKLTKSSPSKATAKPNENIGEESRPEKISQKITKEEPSPEEIKEEKKNPDEAKNEISNVEKNLGAEKKAEKNLEETSAKKSETNPENMPSSIDSLDLSAREKFNIQSQLKLCYNRAIDETQLESELKIIVKAHISEDGYIESDLSDNVDSNRYNNPKEYDYKIAIDNARRAIDLCSPLRNLPLDKYDIWKDVILDFGKSQ